jgi:hypothetical protein
MKWSTACTIIGLYAVGWVVCFAYEKAHDQWVEAHRPPPLTDAEWRAAQEADTRENQRWLANFKEELRQTNCSIAAEKKASYRLPPDPSVSGVGVQVTNFKLRDKLVKACYGLK